MSIGILPSVNSLKLNRDAKQETSACSRAMRLKNNQVKSRTRGIILQKKKRKRRQQCSGYCENLYHNWLVCRKTRSHGFLKEANKPQGNLMQKVLGPNSIDSLSLHHVKQVSAKRKDHRLEKISQKSSSAKSLRYEFCGPVP